MNKKALRRWWKVKVRGMKPEEYCRQYGHAWRYSGHRNHYIDGDRLVITDDYGVLVYGCACCTAVELRIS